MTYECYAEVPWAQVDNKHVKSNVCLASKSQYTQYTAIHSYMYFNLCFSRKCSGRTFKLSEQLVVGIGVEAGADEGEDGQLLHLLLVG